MKGGKLHKAMQDLFPTRQERDRFLRRIKKMPSMTNTHPGSGKVAEDFGLFFKSGSYNLLYYVADPAGSGKVVSRMISLNTHDVYQARAMRDSVIEITGTGDNAPKATGLRGARWAHDNPTSMNNVRVVVYVKCPERQRKFSSTGDASAIAKALECRTESARKYLKTHDPQYLDDHA